MEILTTTGDRRRLFTCRLNPKLVNNGGVILYGAGKNAALLLECFHRNAVPVKIQCIVDANEQKHGTYMLGIPIIAPDALKGYSPDLFIIVTPDNGALTITEMLKTYGFVNILYYSNTAACLIENAIILERQYSNRKYELDQMLMDNTDKMDFICSKLADSKSKDIMAAYIASRFRLDHNNLINCYTANSDFVFYYPSDGIIALDTHEVYVDCGAYDGCTAVEFAKRAENYKRIYVFEPEPVQYEITKAALAYERLERYELYNLGIWSGSGELSFARAEGGGSRIDVGRSSNAYTNYSNTIISTDNITIKTDSLDNLLFDKPDRPTYIKMDIEGAELDALIGAQRIIERDLPKLAISVYHKPEDIWEIPYHILKNYPDYRIYLRQHNAVTETVMYAVQ